MSFWIYVMLTLPLRLTSESFLGGQGGRTKLINTSKLLEILCQLQLFDVSKDLQTLVTFFEKAKKFQRVSLLRMLSCQGCWSRDYVLWSRFRVKFSRCLVAKSLPPRPSRSIHFWPLKWPETHRPHGTPGKWSNPLWWSQNFFPALPSVFQYHLQSQTLESSPRSWLNLRFSSAHIFLTSHLLKWRYGSIK